jgi:hypothetical protein
VGIENRIFLQHGWGQVEETSCWSLRCRGTLWFRPPLLSLAISLWLVIPLRCATERVELAFSNIKFPLAGKYGTCLGGEFVTQMDDLWAG